MKPETLRIVWLYLAMAFLFHLGLGQALAYIVIFQEDRGLDAFQRSQVNAVFWGVTLLAEIPTGILADRWIGRKGSIVAAFFLEAVCFACYGTFTTIEGFMVAEVFSALSNACFSGAYTAWLSDSLHQTGDEKLVAPLTIKGSLLRCCGWMIGSVMVSRYIAYSDKLPWIIGGTLITLTGVLALLVMKEPKHGVAKKGEKAPLREALAHPPVIFALATWALFSFVLQVPNMLWSPYFRAMTNSKEAVGPIFSIAIAFTAIGGWLAHQSHYRKFDSCYGMLVSFVVTAIGISATVVMGSFVGALSIYLVHELGRGFYFPMKDAYLTQHLPEKDKATFLSYGSMPMHFASVAGLLLWGKMETSISEHHAWLSAGGVLIAGTLSLMTWGLPALRRWESSH